MSTERKKVEFIGHEKQEDGTWREAGEFAWRTSYEETAILYAANVVRLRHLKKAEEGIKDYRHPEPLKIGGKIKTVEIHNAVDILERPFLSGMKGTTGTPKAMEEIQNALQGRTQWRTKKETGIQTFASIGWLVDAAKARPPAVTKEGDDEEYIPELLPGNLMVKEESAPSGYNENQTALLKETKEIAAECLKKCGGESATLEKAGVIEFGEKVFRVYSRVFRCLPDPEEEERAKFDAMRQKAAANKDDDDD